MNEPIPDILKELQKPFPTDALGLKIQSVFDKEAPESKALIAPFIDSRDVSQRLDDVVGLEWYDSYSSAPKGGLECALTVKGVTRRDVGSDDNDTEAEKSSYSDAFKRAAVKFGIGRYLYQQPKLFAWVVKRGKAHYLKDGEDARLRKALGGDKSSFYLPASSASATGHNSGNTATTDKKPETKVATESKASSSIPKPPIIKNLPQWDKLVNWAVTNKYVPDPKQLTAIYELLEKEQITEVNGGNIKRVTDLIQEKFGGK